MAIGPIELLVVKFPGNQFKGEIAPALRELVDSGTIQIIDLIFAIKDEEGTLAVLELDALGDETLAVFEPPPSELSGSLTEDDARSLTGSLENNSSAAIMLFENVWATKFVDALRNANGQLVLSERVPRAVIDELIAEVAPPRNQSRPARRPDPAKEKESTDMMRRRRGGLVRGVVARTAVVVGTASAVAGGVQHHQQEKYAAQDAQAQDQLRRRPTRRPISRSRWPRRRPSRPLLRPPPPPPRPGHPT